MFSFRKNSKREQKKQQAQGLLMIIDALNQLEEQSSEFEARLQEWSFKCNDGIKALRSHQIVFHAPADSSRSGVSSGVDTSSLSSPPSIHTIDTFFFDQQAIVHVLDA